LNAASSLRYPTRFTGKVRKVFLSGEAYFEVAEDERHPFVVDAGNTNVTVLGTKFNISSYTNDPGQKITLAEGSVLVNEKRNDKNKGVVLKPGFEAVIRNNENNVRVNKANVEAALAWKNGMFIFDSESLGSLMRKLSRWYNVDVKYDDGVDTLFHFTGRIRRYEDIAGILHLIELTGKVKFSLRQHEIEISPK
jgi:ferric-dicitrate binding protein FerR (iron transport regulator)